MAKVKLGFKDLSVPSQIERTRLIITSLTGNVNFVSPNPTLAALTLAVNALEIAYNKSRGRDKNKMEVMRLRRKEMLDLVVQLAAYVQNASAGATEKIISSGFDVVRQKTTPPQVTKVYNVRVRKGSKTGSVKINWNPVKAAKVYMVRALTETDVPDKLEIKAISSAARCEIEELTPGLRYYILIAAIGSKSIGQWSDPAFKIVE